MSLYLITADSMSTLATDDPVIPAASVGPLQDAAAALAGAAALRARAAADAEAAVADGHSAGHAAGYAEGRSATMAEASAELLALTGRADADRARVRNDVSQLALEVVRRIAGEIGEADTVAALASRAAADLLPDAVATVRVRPEALEATAARLAGNRGLTVIADPALAFGDCLIETPLGISHAGLDIQLAAVERAWSAALPEGTDAR